MTASNIPSFSRGDTATLLTVTIMTAANAIDKQSLKVGVMVREGIELRSPCE